MPLSIGSRQGTLNPNAIRICRPRNGHECAEIAVAVRTHSNTGGGVMPEVNCARSAAGLESARRTAVN